MKKAIVAILLIITITLFGGGLSAIRYFDNAIFEYRYSVAGVDSFFDTHEPQPFINDVPSPISDRPTEHADEKYSFTAPEGFSIRSYSYAWDYEMLELLYHELLRNRHGAEINILYEIVIYPQEADDLILGSFSPMTAETGFAMNFPALPEDFNLALMLDVGRIVLYGGDTNTTIESMAGILSHEYGHLFTFYHMFDMSFENVADSHYAQLRQATKYGLITEAPEGDFYRLNHFRFLIEVAAEDYVQLMGSPTVRQVGAFVDVRQMLLNDLENPPFSGIYRNAFPQLNMKIPLASEVPGLREYFFSYIDEEPVMPIEERMEINLEIRPVTVSHDLVTGRTAFTHHVITWNTPYQDAIYTLATYDPNNYSGLAQPIKTIFQGQEASAIIGSITTTRGNMIHSLDDGLADGTRVFYVVALLPDGTFYLSERLEVQF